MHNILIHWHSLNLNLPSSNHEQFIIYIPPQQIVYDQSSAKIGFITDFEEG